METYAERFIQENAAEIKDPNGWEWVTGSFERGYYGGHDSHEESKVIAGCLVVRTVWHGPNCDAPRISRIGLTQYED